MLDARCKRSPSPPFFFLSAHTRSPRPLHLAVGRLVSGDQGSRNRPHLIVLSPQPAIPEEHQVGGWRLGVLECYKPARLHACMPTCKPAYSPTCEPACLPTCRPACSLPPSPPLPRADLRAHARTCPPTPCTPDSFPGTPPTICVTRWTAGCATPCPLSTTCAWPATHPSSPGRTRSQGALGVACDQCAVRNQCCTGTVGIQ